jgi:hypothetical protein
MPSHPLRVLPQESAVQTSLSPKETPVHKKAAADVIGCRLTMSMDFQALLPVEHSSLL